MLTEMRDCTKAEISDHIAYLQEEAKPDKKGCGSSLPRLLSNEGWHLKRAVIDSICHLGLMPTAWSELGEYVSKGLYGALKFLVGQVRQTLRDIKSPDEETKRVLDRIECFIKHFRAKAESGDLEQELPELRITAVEELCATLDLTDRKAWGYVIRDGCKRSVAFYESAKLLKIDRTTFRIHLITKR